MKKIIILFISIFIISCKKEKDIEIEGSHCFPKGDKEWYMDKEYKNELMLVIKEELNENTYYYLRPSLSSSSMKLSPCNLPSQYKDENIALKISGRVYSHPRIDMNALPFEITKIEKAD